MLLCAQDWIVSCGFPYLSPCFLLRLSHIAFCQFGRLTDQSPRDLNFLRFNYQCSNQVTIEYHQTWLLHGCWGSAFRSSCLDKKISLLRYLFYLTVDRKVTDLWKWQGTVAFHISSEYSWLITVVTMSMLKVPLYT